MTIRAKLTLNAALVVGIVFLLAGLGIASLTFIQSRLSYLLTSSTPFQVRTTDLQRCLQSAVSDLTEISVSSGNAEYKRNREGFEKSMSEVKEAEAALDRLTGQSKRIYDQLMRIGPEVYEVTEKRIGSESDVLQANKLITQRMREMSSRLSELEAKVTALQASSSRILSTAFESSRTSSSRLRNIETLKSLMEQVQTMLLTLLHTKERKQTTILKSKMSGLVDSMIENSFLKESRETMASVMAVKQKVPEIFEAHAIFLKQQDDDMRQKLEAVVTDLKDNVLGQAVVNLNQNIDVIVIETASLNRRQDSAFQQSGSASYALSNNAALLAAGLSIEGLSARLFNARSASEIDRIAVDLKGAFDRIALFQKNLEQGLARLDAQDEIKLLRSAVAALGSVRELVFTNDGVIAKVRVHVLMNEKAALATEHMRKVVAGYAEEGRKAVLTAHEEQENAAGAVTRLVRLSIIINVVVGSVVALLAFFMGMALYRVIVKPVKKAKDALESAEASNNLTICLDIANKDEIGDMCAGYNRFAAKLRETIESISGFTNTLASSSAELSATSTVMAGRARTQATETTGIATAAEEMSSTVLDVAKNARGTSDFARELKTIAENGGEVVMQTIDGISEVASSMEEITLTMKGLSASSEKIGKIVSVIRDIAEQTNLLALNAAIEAARAGDQGRGFAVVADEVRKLAEKTSGATLEITGMIQSIQSEAGKAVQSMDRGMGSVNNGVALSNKGREALADISGGIEQITDMINHIAAASNEQSTAVDMISSNVNSISETNIEFSAAMAQSAQAAEDLDRLAASLRTLVGEFRI
ncbi:MAG: methyl-accepting chemotaxis protein [Thermodesulfovibrionales bacterium]|jgi:methyl-accepting chemotaxis protein